MSSYFVENLPEPLRERRIISARLDAFTLGFSIPESDDEEATMSQNHWAWSFVIANGRSIRFSMESSRNPKTGRFGLLKVREVSYDGLSYSVLKSLNFKTATITIGHIVDMVLLYKLDHYEMVQNDAGKFKGCRHWCQKLGEFLEAHKWIDGIATSGEVVETILPYVYTRYEGKDEVWAARVEVDEGIFN